MFLLMLIVYWLNDVEYKMLRFTEPDRCSKFFFNQWFVCGFEIGNVCETFWAIFTQQIDLITNWLLFKLEITAVILI